MTIPTVHLNGTSQDALIDQLCDARMALNLAIDALDDAAPNGRDYYPQGPGAFERAVAEHAARAAKLREVRDELGALTIAILDGGYQS